MELSEEGRKSWIKQREDRQRENAYAVPGQDEIAQFHVRDCLLPVNVSQAYRMSVELNSGAGKRV